MKITSAEIKDKTFEKIFRGYDKDEVSNFLAIVAKDYESLLEEKSKLEGDLAKAQAEANKLKQVEESLFRTLKTAEDTGASIIEEATTAADEIMGAAKENSEGMLIDAQRKANAILEEAEQKAKHILEGVKADVTGLIRNYEHLIAQRELTLRNLHKLTDDIQDNITVSNETFKKVNLSVYEDMVQNFAKPKTAIILPDEELAKAEDIVFVQEEISEEVTLEVSVEHSEEKTEALETIDENTEEITAAEDSVTEEIENSITEEVEENFEAEEKKEPIAEVPVDPTDDKKKKGGSFFDQFD
ncbi:MAG: DivIVA domain-containing protein [Mongoliitalea sp.]